MMPAATDQAWSHPNKRRYGAVESYQIAAAWLSVCAEVADWGAGGRFFQGFLPADVRYRAVDGTLQIRTDALADLATFQEPSEGILLRHVVDNTPAWRSVLRNAIASFTRRLVVVTYTPDVNTTRIDHLESGWPVWHFNPSDLRAEMGPLRVREIMTAAAPERVYLLERAS